MTRAGFVACVAFAAALVPARVVAAQSGAATQPAARDSGAVRTHVVIVSGLGGEPAYVESFRVFADSLARVARSAWRVADDDLYCLGDSATRRTLADVFLQLGTRAAPDDRVLVFVQGHGSGEGRASRLAISGPDVTAADFATWLSGLRASTVAFVHAGSGSGDFADVLAAPGRAIVTATRTAFERNATTFGTPFVQGLLSGEADIDRDGRTTLLEAFTYADSSVARAFAADNRLRTEHARLSDSTLAARIVLGPPAQIVTPAVAALLAVRDARADSVRALRAQRDALPAARYRAQLEALLLGIARDTRAIRAAGGTP